MTLKKRVLIFIGSLRSGGKERRLVELLTYLSSTNQFEVLVAVTKDEVDYQQFFKLNIQYKVLKKRWKKNDPTIFYEFYNCVKKFRPHLIHTWGRMQSLYAIPAIILYRIPLVNSQITGAPVRLNTMSLERVIDKLNFQYSRIILANSQAGIDTFNPPRKKSRVIYNGINLNRFINLTPPDVIKKKYAISTQFAVIMTASFTPTKNYKLFFNIADAVTKQRSDITFLGVGGFDNDDSEYKKISALAAGNTRILFPGKVADVEALVSACTVGVLFSTNGEGISNSIMEYMALGKPIIASSGGGMKEIVQHNLNGYLIEDETEQAIIALLYNLIESPEKCRSFGEVGKKIIAEQFTIEKMGVAFKEVYTSLIVSEEEIDRRQSLQLTGFNDYSVIEKTV